MEFGGAVTYSDTILGTECSTKIVISEILNILKGQLNFLKTFFLRLIMSAELPVNVTQFPINLSLFFVNVIMFPEDVTGLPKMWLSVLSRGV